MKNRLLLASLVLVTSTPLARAANWFVDSVAGSNSNTGLSWTQAFSTVQAAVTAALPNDTIHVRNGVYFVNGANGALVINKTLTILGGYSNCGLQRPRSSPSYLYNMGPQNTSNTPIITKTGTGDLTLDGFRIWNGYASWGGGLDASGGTVNLNDCYFAINGAALNGGHVRMQNGDLNVKRCRFSSGSAVQGAGIWMFNGNVSILSNFFEICQANGWGGALYLNGTNGNISNNTFFGNNAGGGSGPIFHHLSGSVVFKNNLLNMPLGTAGAACNSTLASPSITLGNNHFWQWPGTKYSWTAGGAGDAATDPQLASDNLHIASTSPLLNTGDPAVVSSTQDYDGEVRIFGASIDRGADEIAPRNLFLLLSGCIRKVGTLGGSTSGVLRLMNNEGVGTVIDLSVGADGEFARDIPALPYGFYTATFKGKNTLSQSVLIELSAEEPVLSFSLLPGDIDDDNAVTVFDYALLSDAFDSVPGTINWNPLADLDDDGAVSVFDYALLSDNFDKVGD